MSQITNEEERKQTQFCNLHEKEVERRNDKMDILFTKVDALHSDIVWIRRFGCWWMGVTGAALILCIPFFLAFAVYVHSIDTRLSAVEQSLKDHFPTNIQQSVMKDKQ